MKYSFYVTFELEDENDPEEVAFHILQYIAHDDMTNLRVIPWRNESADLSSIVKQSELRAPWFQKIPERKRESIYMKDEEE